MTFDPWAKFKGQPLVTDRRELPAVRREWMGDRVCIRYVSVRGNSRRRTLMRFAFGTLVEGERGDNMAVMTKDGYKGLHYTRVTEVWNLSKPRREDTRRADWLAAGSPDHAYQRAPLGLPGCATCAGQERHYMHTRVGAGAAR